MVDINNKLELCSICRDEYTSINSEAAPGVILHVCQKCLDLARDNFIWICLGCGQVHFRSKKQVIAATTDFELKRAYMLCEDQTVIQGIDICISCDPEGIMEYVESNRSAVEC
ncbi:MAG: hypothetical protein ISR96_04395 [Nitrospira sp.]|nr:hypothetical protein [bacterium]MBL7048745.1 hypothetical protein [Nitrospira sp.]